MPRGFENSNRLLWVVCCELWLLTATLKNFVKTQDQNILFFKLFKLSKLSKLSSSQWAPDSLVDAIISIEQVQQNTITSITS